MQSLSIYSTLDRALNEVKEIPITSVDVEAIQTIFNITKEKISAGSTQGDFFSLTERFFSKLEDGVGREYQKRLYRAAKGENMVACRLFESSLQAYTNSSATGAELIERVEKEIELGIKRRTFTKSLCEALTDEYCEDSSDNERSSALLSSFDLSILKEEQLKTITIAAVYSERADLSFSLLDLTLSKSENADSVAEEFFSAASFLLDNSILNRFASSSYFDHLSSAFLGESLIRAVKVNNRMIVDTLLNSHRKEEIPKGKFLEAFLLNIDNKNIELISLSQSSPLYQNLDIEDLKVLMVAAIKNKDDDLSFTLLEKIISVEEDSSSTIETFFQTVIDYEALPILQRFIESPYFETIKDDIFLECFALILAKENLPLIELLFSSAKGQELGKKDLSYFLLTALRIGKKEMLDLILTSPSIERLLDFPLLEEYLNEENLYISQDILFHFLDLLPQSSRSDELKGKFLHFILMVAINQQESELIEKIDLSPIASILTADCISSGLEFSLLTGLDRITDRLLQSSFIESLLEIDPPIYVRSPENPEDDYPISSEMITEFVNKLRRSPCSQELKKHLFGAVVIISAQIDDVNLIEELSSSPLFSEISSFHFETALEDAISEGNETLLQTLINEEKFSELDDESLDSLISELLENNLSQYLPYFFKQIEDLNILGERLKEFALNGLEDGTRVIVNDDEFNSIPIHYIRQSLITAISAERVTVCRLIINNLGERSSQIDWNRLARIANRTSNQELIRLIASMQFLA